MFRIICLSACVLISIIAARPGFATTFQIPDSSDKMFSVDLPDSWQPEETENGADATSDDGLVYIAVEVVEADNEKKVEVETRRFLAGERSLTIKEDSRSTSPSTLAGYAASQVMWEALEDGRRTTVVLSMAKISIRRYLVVIYWGPASAGQNAAAIKGVFDSLR